MKLIFILSAFTISIQSQRIFGHSRTLENLPSEGPTQRKLSHILQMVNTQIQTHYSTTQIGKMIQNYGCHCFPSKSKAAGGSGPAQDQTDLQCRKLAQCHRCIEMDYPADISNAWNADIGKYRWSLNNDGSISCNSNPDDNKKDLCKCDADFATELGKIWEDSGFNFTLWENKSNTQFDFDYDSVCVKQGGQITDNCCGDYPKRYPFDSLLKECCGGVSVPVGQC